MISRNTMFCGHLAAAGMLVSFAAGPLIAGETLPVLRVGIVTDGPTTREHAFVEDFAEEITGVTAGSYTVELPKGAVLDGGREPEEISAAVDRMLTRTDLDVIVVAGFRVADEICSRAELATPVVVPFAFDGSGAGCRERANVRVRPVNLRTIVARDLVAFHELMRFSSLAVLVDPTWPCECTEDEIASLLAPAEVRVQFVHPPTNLADVADLLPPGTEGVYIMPLLQLDASQLVAVAAALTERGVPTFSMIGESEVELGVLAGLTTNATLTAWVRGAALEVLDLVEGRESRANDAADVTSQLIINMETARRLGFTPSWELLTRARLVHDEGSRRHRPIDLASVVRLAVDQNLDLAVQDRRVAAGAEAVRDARSSYRPRVDVGLAGVAIDENHAIAALGQYSMYAAGSVTLTQLIWSDGASANIEIQNELQRVRELDLDALRLDIARDAVAAFTGVMRTAALVRVRQQQVDLTQTNLGLARLRRVAGATGAAEVHRWEAELAGARASLLDAISAKSMAERQLSRLLGESLTTRWAVKEPEIEVALEILGGATQAGLLDTPDGYQLLSERLVSEGLERAPELAALDAAIVAQERALESAKRASYAPQVGLQADVGQILAKDTAGGIDLGDISELIPPFDDTSWRVTVHAGLPVVTGGATKARRIRALEELFALRIDRRNAEDKLSQRVLSALDMATASWATIGLRREAADAAWKTLDLVRDSYARGAASILDLLDAQNSALQAELAAETAVYDFVDDWAEVRRAVAGLVAV